MPQQMASTLLHLSESLLQSYTQECDRGNFCLGLITGRKIINMLSHLSYNLMQGCYLPSTVEETEAQRG